MTPISTPVRADGLVIKDANGVALATALTMGLAQTLVALINAAAAQQ